MLALHLQQQEQTEFVKVFLYHFQFVNWIAWGQAKVLAWGSWYVSIISTFPNTFALVLTLTCMIWMELTRTDAVFMQNYHGVICVQKEMFSEWPETSRRIFLEYIKNTGESIYVRGPTPCPRGWRARPPPGARPLPHGPPEAPPTTTPTLYIHFHGEKNQEERFIAFYDTEPPPSPNLSREGWSGVRWGLRRGGFDAVVIINHPPSPISWCLPPCVSNSIVGLLDGDGLDEIYHVIELVLLRFDP